MLSTNIFLSFSLHGEVLPVTASGGAIGGFRLKYPRGHVAGGILRLFVPPLFPPSQFLLFLLPLLCP
jgi:hypothetical protein